MASLVYVTNNPVPVMRVPLRLIHLLPSDAAILTAIIRRHGELTPELEQPTNLAWCEPQRVGDLEVIVAKNSQLKTHEPRQSESADSDALYFGENDELGMQLQYLGPDAWRTRDAVAHTSVHHHELSVETYYLLHGAASIELRDTKTGDRRQASQIDPGADKITWQRRGYAVPVNVQHPIVAGEVPSIMLIVTDPPNNTKSDHHYDGLFRDVFADVIASCKRKMRGPSAMGLEGGNR